MRHTCECVDRSWIGQGGVQHGVSTPLSCPPHGPGRDEQSLFEEASGERINFSFLFAVWTGSIFEGGGRGVAFLLGLAFLKAGLAFLKAVGG